MIDVDDVHFTYPQLDPALPAPHVLRGLSLAVPAGEGVAVLGASDSGKSTLCHLLAGLAPRHTGGTVEGHVHVAGHDVLAAMPPTGAVGLLFQDAATQLFNSTVEREVAWGLEAMGLPPDAISARVAEELARFGLRAIRHRQPWALSGGQQKRLALASVWAMRPRVLLLDAPLGGLDPEGRAEVVRAVDALHPGATTLLVTTVNPQAAALAARATVLTEGTASSPAPTPQVLARTEQLLESGVLYPPSYWPNLSPTAQPASGSPPAIALTDLRFHYPDGPEVLRGLDLEIPAGQFVAVVGPNGAGKSTLVRHFNGLLRPTGGQVRVRGRATDQRSVGELAHEVSFLFQRPEQQLFAPTVRQEIAFGLRHLPQAEAAPRIDAALARFGLRERAEHPPAILGYGAQRAVTLASLAVRDTSILVLDEPTVGLDGRGWAQLLSWLAERRAAGVTLIVVTHEIALAARADRVLLLEEGRVRGDGPPDAVLPRFEVPRFEGQGDA